MLRELPSLLGKSLKTKILFCGLSLCAEGAIAGFQSQKIPLKSGGGQFR
jgi:hypothetical protein